MISLEAIESHKIESFSTYKTIQNCDFFLKTFITISQGITKYDRNTSHNFHEMLQYIYIFHFSIKNRLILRLASNLLKTNQLPTKSKEIKQYIKKFTYLYFFKYKSYYQSSKFLNFFYFNSINEIAISNLYILYIINTYNYKQSIYFLITYLYI